MREDNLRDADILTRLECWQVQVETPWQPFWNIALNKDATDAIAEIKKLREQLKGRSNG